MAPSANPSGASSTGRGNLVLPPRVTRVAKRCLWFVPLALVLMVASGRSAADDAWVPEAERATIDEGMRAREPLSEREQAVGMDPGSAGGCAKRRGPPEGGTTAR
ncbi:MAG: hypothetical protein AAF500_14785 [Myxococcota bacterium]